MSATPKPDAPILVLYVVGGISNLELDAVRRMQAVRDGQSSSPQKIVVVSSSFPSSDDMLGFVLQAK
jgi:hypothetical protein